MSGTDGNCSSCGQPLAAGAAFCNGCGASQTPATTTSTTGGPPPTGGGAGGQAPDWQRSLSSLGLTRDDWILGGLALFLFIDLLALPWFEASAFGFSASLTATQSPDGWLCVLAVLACAALIVDLLIERLAPQASLPAIGGSRATTRLALAALAAALIALKFVLHIHFSLFAAGFYLAVIAAAAMVVMAARARQA